MGGCATIRQPPSLKQPANAGSPTTALQIQDLFDWDGSVFLQRPATSADFGVFLIGGTPLHIGRQLPMRFHDEQEDGDTGRMIWESSVAMAKLMECNSHLVQGCRVLELGAGRGVTGMTAVLLGAKHVVLTDLPYCMQMLNDGLALNGLANDPSRGGAEVAEFSWDSPSEFLDARPGQTFDVVISTDCVWLPKLVQPFVSALRAICVRSPHAEILLLNVCRLLALEDTFLKTMAQAGFQIAWKLCGGDSLMWSIGHPGSGAPNNPDNVDWHPDYRPIARLSLWSFRWQPECHAGYTSL